jgi:hypothetical protein
MILAGFFASTTIVPAASTDVLFFLATDKNANHSSTLKYIEYIVNDDDDDFQLDCIVQKRIMLMII